MACPDCGGRQFQTAVQDIGGLGRPPGYNRFETTLARFNPYIPR